MQGITPAQMSQRSLFGIKTSRDGGLMRAAHDVPTVEQAIVDHFHDCLLAVHCTAIVGDLVFEVNQISASRINDLAVEPAQLEGQGVPTILEKELVTPINVGGSG